MRRVTTRADLLGALPGDLLLAQLANRWVEDRPAWALGGAVAMYHLWGDEPDLVFVGDSDDVVTLAHALRDGGEWLGWFSAPRPAIDRLVAEGGLTEHVGWAFRWTDEAPLLPTEGVRWEPDEAEVSAVLKEGFPDASMPVGHPDVRRWAGLRRDGRLVAVAADATQTPGLGFLASIATLPETRGTGAGTAVTAWATAELVREHGRCGLWHMASNVVAAALYTRLGYRDDHQMGVAEQDQADPR